MKNRLGEIRIKKSSLIFFLLLPGLYISDILYGVIEYYEINIGIITPGILLRGMVVCIAALVLVQGSRFVPRRLVRLVLLVALCFIPSLVVSAIWYGDVRDFASDLLSIMKIMYGPLVTLLVVVLLRRFRMPPEELIKYMAYCFYFLGVSLFLMNSIGWGSATYGKYSIGFKGIFFAQNELSLSLAMAALTAVYRNIKTPSPVEFLLLVVAAVGMSVIGTRASLVSLAAMPFATILVLFLSRKNIAEAGRVRLALWLLAPLLIVGAIWKMHQVYKEAVSYGFLQAKLESIAKGIHPRSSLITYGMQYIENRPWILNITGEGMVAWQEGVYPYSWGVTDVKRKIVEVDFIDMFGAYGIIFVVFYYVLLILLIAFAAIQFWRGRDGPLGIFVMMLLVYLVSSVLAGHAIVSPIGTTQAACAAAAILIYRMRRNALFDYRAKRPRVVHGQQFQTN